MKSLLRNLAMLMVAASFVMLYSCGGDEEDEVDPNTPTITVTSSSSLAVGGSNLAFDLLISAPNGFDRIAIATSLDGADYVFFAEADADDFSGVSDGDVSVTGTLTIAATDLSNITLTSGSDLTFRFQVVDKQGLTATDLVDFEATESNAKVQTAVMLFAPAIDSTTYTFYSIEEDSTYSIEDINNTTTPISASIDLGYFYGQEANLVSPSRYATFTNVYTQPIGAWSKRNVTTMIKTSLTDVTEITTVSDVQAELDKLDFTANGGTAMEGVQVGDIYAFSSETGYTGLIRVIALKTGNQVGQDPNNPEVTGNITLEFILTVSE